MKTMTRESKRLAILAELMKGETANDLGEKYDINPVTIAGWKRQEKKRLEAISVEEVSHVDPVVLEAVVQEVRKKADGDASQSSVQLEVLDKQLELVKGGIVGVQALENEFHQTMMNLLGHANKTISDDMKVSEWTQLVNGVSSLHGTMFGKGSSTQINMIGQNNNNHGSSAEVEKFKGGFRV